MKYFILAAIVFFCARCFSQSFDYYYVDEYIRATEDPDYADYLKQKQAESNTYQNGIDEYKEEMTYDAWVQERQRQDHIDEKALIKPEDNSKVEKEYELELVSEQRKQESIQRGYAIWKEQNATEKWARKNPERMIASLPTYEKIPKPKRKFIFKKPPKK